MSTVHLRHVVKAFVIPNCTVLEKRLLISRIELELTWD